MTRRAAVETADVAEVIVLRQPVAPQVVDLPRRIERIENWQREDLLAQDEGPIVVPCNVLFFAVLLLLFEPLELRPAFVEPFLRRIDVSVDLLNRLFELLADQADRLINLVKCGKILLAGLGIFFGMGRVALQIADLLFALLEGSLRLF